MPSLIEYSPFELLSGLGLLDPVDIEAPLVESDPCGCPPAGGIDLERTRFFARQLVGPEELTADQLYFRGKHRRHNRLLHGWGVVCGARVMADPDNDCGVIVEPGYVLGPWGDEIVLPNRVKVDLCKQDVNGDAVSPCGGDVDPWCSDVRTSRPDDKPLYVAVKYAECDSRPVRVTGCGCGCDEAECEYSRIRDSYAIRVLSELPMSHQRMSRLGSMYGLLWGMTCLGGKGRACPPCPAEPWVVLADVTLSGGKVSEIDCFAHRRYVASGAMFYFQCGPGRAADVGAKDLKQYGRESALIDASTLTEADAVTAAPAATVAMRIGNTWTSVPAQFEVRKDDTVASLLRREGDRELVDPATAQILTLRELYAAAGVDPATPIHSRSDALALLEGQSVDISGLRTVRRSLDGLLRSEGTKRLDEQHGGAPAAALALPAADLQNAGRGAVADALAKLSVRDVADTARKAFVDRIARKTPAADRPAVRERAAAVWTDAQRVARLTAAWERTGAPAEEGETPA
jgi:hypothetical protein